MFEDKWVDGPQLLHLSRCNLLVGANGVGKSSLLSLLIGLVHPHELMRRADNGSSISARLEWFDPQPRKALITANKGSLTYEVDGKRTPYVARPFRSIVVNKHLDGLCSGSVDEIARALGTNTWVVTAVLPQIGRRLGGRVVEADVIDGEVHVRTATWDRLVAWDQRLSGGARAALFFELAIAIADLQSEVEPTLLAFDGVLSVVDDDTREHLLNLMSSVDRSFQSVILQERPLRAGQGWMVTYFARTERGACLRQDVPDISLRHSSTGSPP